MLEGVQVVPGDRIAPRRTSYGRVRGWVPGHAPLPPREQSRARSVHANIVKAYRDLTAGASWENRSEHATQMFSPIRQGSFAAAFLE
jgi:hypothetical protein